MISSSNNADDNFCKTPVCTRNENPAGDLDMSPKIKTVKVQDSKDFRFIEKIPKNLIIINIFKDFYNNIFLDLDNCLSKIKDYKNGLIFSFYHKKIVI
jgi:hypothetical protein